MDTPYVDVSDAVSWIAQGVVMGLAGVCACAVVFVLFYLYNER